jgi:hypothetical protein
LTLRFETSEGPFLLASAHVAKLTSYETSAMPGILMRDEFTFAAVESSAGRAFFPGNIRAMLSAT